MILSRTQKLILSRLKKGKKAAVSRFDLANEFGMTEVAVRKDLAILCKQYPICGGYNSHGYYIAKNKEEIAEYMLHLQNHIKGMKHRFKLMNLHFRKLSGGKNYVNTTKN